MSMGYAPPGREQSGEFFYDADDTHGQGLVTFAGVMLAIAATLNTVYGIAAIDKSGFFVADSKYVLGDLRQWGWFALALGILQAVAAIGIWRGTGWARWFGVACAGGNIVLQLLWLPSYPLMSMAIIPLDLTAMYGLLVYGGRRKGAHAQRAAERAAAG